MSSSSTMPYVYPLGATSAYIAFLSINEDSIPFSSTNKASSSWRRFIHESSEQQHIQSTTIAAIVSSESTTIEGPFTLKPAPTIQELLNGPLFQVAGIFEINEPGWVDKIDEYIAETYL